MYPLPLKYDLHNLQGQFTGFHVLMLILNSKRDSHYCISCGNISQICCPEYEMLSKPLRNVLFLSILKENLS